MPVPIPLSLASARRRLAPGLALAAGAAAALAVPAVLVVLMAVGHWAERKVQWSAPPGVSHDGRPLPAGHALQAWPQALPGAPAATVPPQPLALALREGCAWGQPGRSPYRGTTEQALLGARLPPEVVREVARLRQARLVTDRVEIRTDAIRAVSDGREFSARSFMMTYGHTLCVDARVNFVPGHVEQADLYEVRDARGKLHSVMVPDVCGNVSVLGARGDRLDKKMLTKALAAQGGPVPWVGTAADEAGAPWLGGLRWVLGMAPDGAARPGGGGVQAPGQGQAPGSVHKVPEPGTLAGVLLGLVAMAVQRTFTRRAPSSPPCASSSSSGRRPSSSSSSPASARTDSAGG